ncbi:hypothetical protein ACKS0A_01498 [Histoplasma ohiense]
MEIQFFFNSCFIVAWFATGFLWKRKVIPCCSCKVANFSSYSCNLALYAVMSFACVSALHLLVASSVTAHLISTVTIMLEVFHVFTPHGMVPLCLSTDNGIRKPAPCLNRHVSFPTMTSATQFSSQ